MDLSLLPKPFLVQLFVTVQFDKTQEEYEECPGCFRPYWWILRSKRGRDLRLVCKKWRDLYWNVLVNWPMATVGPLFVCVTPQTCADKVMEMVKKHVEETKKKSCYFKRIYYSTKTKP